MENSVYLKLQPGGKKQNAPRTIQNNLAKKPSFLNSPGSFVSPRLIRILDAF